MTTLITAAKETRKAAVWQPIHVAEPSEPAGHQNVCHLLTPHSLKDACVSNFVLPGYAEFVLQAAHVEGVKPFLLMQKGWPGFAAVE